MIREPSADPADLARALQEQRDTLRMFEGTALAQVAASLSATAESLARTARELREMRPAEWMDARQAASHLSKTEDAFEKIAPTLPRHRLGGRYYYNRAEIDDHLMGL